MDMHPNALTSSSSISNFSSSSRFLPPRAAPFFSSGDSCEENEGEKIAINDDNKNLDSEEMQNKYCKGEMPQWNDFFDTYEEAEFHYEEGKKDSFGVYIAGNSGPLVFCFHGGGHTALSFALVALELKKNMRIIAFDSRGHGKTKTAEEKEGKNEEEDEAICDMSAERLVDDANKIIAFYCDKIKNKSENKTLPSVILLGHSMGGAIAIRSAALGKIENLRGLVVLDVVEGSAMDALPYMCSIVNRRPKSFNSLDEAIAWGIKSNQIKNKFSAQISIPSQLIHKNNKWVWRCDLNKTKTFWEGWFRGLSKTFLSAKCAKILVLAAQDRLDKELMIAHMQGKFQLEIIQQSGHVIEEDQPSQVVKVMNEFVNRYKLDVPLNFITTKQL